MMFFYTLLAVSKICSSKESGRPLVITSKKFLNHKFGGYHPECPERISVCSKILQEMKEANHICIQEPDDSYRMQDISLSVIKNVHEPSYVEKVSTLCSRGARHLSAWDEDTYINKYSFNQTLLTQAAWLTGVDHVIKNRGMAFSLSRPPGHHASYRDSMGFCLFNFAVGAAHYAINHHGLDRIGIIDFDVHYGNGIADLVKSNPKIRYTSIHETGIFPTGRGGVEEKGDFNNILNNPIKYGTKFNTYEPLLTEKSIPFIKEFNPSLVIVCAGYDALSSDELSNVLLQPDDYRKISEHLKQAFGDAILFGLEGGYSLQDLPAAVQSTLLPFI